MIHFLDIIMDPEAVYRIRPRQEKPEQVRKQLTKKEVKQLQKEAKKKVQAEKKAKKKQEKKQVKSAKATAASSLHSTYTEVNAPSPEAASVAAFSSSDVITVALLLTVCMIFAFRLRAYGRR